MVLEQVEQFAQLVSVALLILIAASRVNDLSDGFELTLDVSHLVRNDPMVLVLHLAYLVDSGIVHVLVTPY